MNEVKDTISSLSKALQEIRFLQDAIDDDTIDEINSMDMRRIKAKANRIQEVAVNILFPPK